ncbi:hypothetical protein P175DRAFT_0530216 [Aspergillus ochraceoroseus IBT 24754]|uniref:Uncharacterized protein n=1 Tax=Aspergillus ochraceoroseus IBT 24754 TaxID=1392256 RepID=A0A2T5M3N0_9EURO|nr:uncharacterized protein P175DRAFT_0530216 [Aspergillus ochraceoroseus IBT 24754]PTU23122.1 hypothetical protein P175DRAFT_0530216 [Aspergillus ochraceoroseus IBT 24754]
MNSPRKEPSCEQPCIETGRTELPALNRSQLQSQRRLRLLLLAVTLIALLRHVYVMIDQYMGSADPAIYWRGG